MKKFGVTILIHCKVLSCDLLWCIDIYVCDSSFKIFCESFDLVIYCRILIVIQFLKICSNKLYLLIEFKF